MAGASSSSSSGGSWKYDVFINFRGEDTRRGFVCHLYQALKQKALDTFIDSEALRKGDDLSELLKAIQGSRLSIVVFSKNYASSTWCLKELAQILKCIDTQKQIVVPIFYEVDPSDVRKQRGSFAEAFAKYASDSNVDMEELESWKCGLNRATNFSGWDSKNYQDDTILIKSIVEDILKKLIHISPSEPDGLVGMDSHIKEIDLLLQLGVDDFRIVGIWGMGGIGKSTIAKAVYDKIAHQFEHSCFLDNVKEGFLTKNGGAKVTEELLSKILKVNDRHILDGGLNMIRERLGKKKVLLVLDDVDNLNQIETLIGKKPSFGGGSRIIITSRDKHLLAGYVIYEPKSFTDDKALELFRQYAFRTNPPSGNYDDLSMRAIKYAHGLPLALKVLGAFLDNKSVPEWEDELEKIKKIPNTGIQGVLRTSFDGLDDSQKNIFLDIACFFRGYDKEDATELLDSFGFFPHSGLRVLVDRALVTLSCYNRLEMHDLIQEMGWDIVKGDPRGPSRLWKYEDVHRVLSQNTDTGAVEAIVLNLSELKEELHINAEVFVSMKKLRLLQLVDKRAWFHLDYTRRAGLPPCKDLFIKNCEHMSGDLKFLSDELKFLIWHKYPIKSLSSNFDPKNLVHLEMPHSRIEQLWEGIKPLQNLVHIDLRGSQYLIKTPDLTLATNLKKLNLQGCVSLVEVHPSISALKNLACLNLRGCKELKNFPSFIDMKSLQSLSLSGCSNLKKFRLEFSEDMKELRVLLLDESAITKITSSINNHPRLQTLGLRGCRELRSLPSSIHLESLVKLDLSGCSNLEEFPEISGDMNMLSRLNLDETAIKELPSSIEFLQGLKTLTMSNCRSLVFLPDNICKLACLEELYLDRCSKLSNLPENLGDLKHLSYLRVERSGIQQLPFSISRLSELELLSSWPTWIQENPSYSALDYLDLSDCNLLELSDGIVHLSSLRSLRLCRNNNLESLPAAMNRLIQLSELYLEGCKRLKSIPELSSSIRFIDAHDCTALKTVSTRKHPSFEKFSTSFTFYFCHRRMQTNQKLPLQLQKLPLQLQKLLQLDLSGCSNLEEFPEISGYIYMLSRLKLDGTAIKELPSSIEFLQGLCTLTMSNCRSLIFLPDNICKLARLEELYLDGCSKLSNLPENFGDLKDLSDLQVQGSGIQQLPFSILRLSELEDGSLSCKGCKEMTAPFSSWPTWIQENPTYSVLVELDLSDCNLLDLLDGIAHLSSLRSLNLCRNNNLESLPAAMNRLIQLSELYLEGCKRLKSIPELSSSIRLIDAHDCTALKTVSTPKRPYFEKFSTCFRFYNCFQLMQTNLFTDIVETAADNQAYYHPVSLFVSLPAGSDIPDWFNHRCRGSSVTVQLPPNWLANKFVGLAICAISNLRGADNSQTLRSAICWCTFKANDGDEESFHFPLVDDLGETDRLLESDHMFLRYENSSSLGEWHNKGKYTEARFRIVTGDNGVIPNDSMTLEDCTWITSCGVRLFDANNEFSFSNDLCDLERSNRKRVTVKKKKERKRVPPLQNDSMSLQNKSTASCVYDFSKMSNRKRVTVKKKKERERVPPFQNDSMSLQNKSTASRVYDFSKVAEALAIMDKEALDSLPFSQRRKDFS